MFKKVCNIISVVMLVVMTLLAGILMLPYLFGYQPLAVLSGSMQRSYPVGSIIFVKKVAPEEIKVGDAITFQLSGGMAATHRVVSIDTAKKQFVTKGDENNTNDSPISFEALIGRASPAAIPYLGYLSVEIKTPRGIMGVTGVVVLILLLLFLPEIVEAKPKEKDVIQESTDSKQ
ncbi:MAG: signal peptidase I [Clostridiales bacterium]|nr:signal peptidase I [Clostridiales bacterium]